MTAKSLISKILFVLAIPVVFLGLIDPLEGGLALLLVGAIYAIAFLLIRTKPLPFLWIPYAAAVVLGVVTILLAMTRLSQEPYEPINPIVLVGVWVYRFAVAATLVGAIMTAVKFVFRKS